MLKVIAECGVNFSNQLEAARMIKYAKAAGAHAVKFQLFNEETIKDSPLKDELTPLILDKDKVSHLRLVAEVYKIDLVLTPMYFDAVDLAAEYADIIKIRYKDHENEGIITKVLDTGKPVLISVPRPPINPKIAWNPRVYSLFCIPRYPPEPEDFNLDAACACKGFSSHYPHTIIDTLFAINRLHDDSYLEKHVMLNSTEYLREPIDASVSITFDRLKNFINELSIIERIQRTRL